MKLKFDAPKGTRFKKGFLGFEADNRDWMFNCDLKKWEQEMDHKYGYSSHRPCNSIKAFRRMLKTAPKGVKFRLVSIYVGYDVYGYGDK